MDFPKLTQVARRVVQIILSSVWHRCLKPTLAASRLLIDRRVIVFERLIEKIALCDRVRHRTAPPGGPLARSARDRRLEKAWSNRIRYRGCRPDRRIPDSARRRAVEGRVSSPPNRIPGR